MLPLYRYRGGHLNQTQYWLAFHNRCRLQPSSELFGHFLPSFQLYPPFLQENQALHEFGRENEYSRGDKTRGRLNL